MCDLCEEKYHTEGQHICPICLKLLPECSGTNRYLERHNIHCIGKVFKYEGGHPERAQNQLVFRLKKANSKAVFQFVAEEMAPIVERLASDAREKYILVGAPRSFSGIRRYGYDHVAILTKEISKLTGIPYVKAILRKGHTGQQKTKTKQQRIDSATISYRKNAVVDIKGKRVILIDDIITTGATIAACAHVLRKMGVRTVKCATLGIHYRYDQLVDHV